MKSTHLSILLRSGGWKGVVAPPQRCRVTGGGGSGLREVWQANQVGAA